MPLAAAALAVAVLAAACLPTPAANTPGRTGPSAVPSAGASASAKASPTPRAFVAAIEAFAAQAAGGKMTYRVAFKGIASSSTHTLPIAGSMDVSGADFASSFTYDWTGEAPGLSKFRVQVRSVRGKGYVKAGPAAWRALSSFPVSQSYSLFKHVTSVKDVRYLGPARMDGKVFHKVAIPGALLMHPNTLPYLFAKEKVDQTYLEVVIDDAGRPRAGTWSMRAQARVGIGEGQLQRLNYDVDLTFAKVGAKLTIKRP